MTAVAENQPNKNRMNAELINFAARLRRIISEQDDAFDGLALELFGLQFKCNPAYRRICEAKGLTPNNIRHWTEVPFAPTAAFKELELSSISAEERTAVFHSSGTTEQKPSRHFHCPKSLELYELSLWAGFAENVLRTGAGQASCLPTVAQTSKSAVSQVSKPAGHAAIGRLADLEIGDTAGLETCATGSA